MKLKRVGRVRIRGEYGLCNAKEDADEKWLATYQKVVLCILEGDNELLANSVYEDLLESDHVIVLELS